MTVHDRITFFRQRAGITKSELATACDVTAGAVTQWENGGASPTGENQLRICRALGVSMGAFWADEIEAA